MQNETANHLKPFSLKEGPSPKILDYEQLCWVHGSHESLVRLSSFTSLPHLFCMVMRVCKYGFFS